jgi:Tol biopolymer transport system component
VAAGLVALVAGGAWYLWAGRGGAGRSTQPVALRFRTDRLTAHAGVEQFPSLTPDGKWLLYAGEETGNRDIYLLSTSGENPRNLTADSPADDDEPAASPNGERIAFRSSREGGGVFVMGLTGENVRRVTPIGVKAAFNPAWSPDGTEIAYTTENVQLSPLNWETKSELWVVKVDTGEQRQIAVPDAVQAAWSPHGKRISYASRREKPANADQGDAAGIGRAMDIYTVPVSGGEPVAATDDRFADWCPVWSPDGKYLYYVSDRGGSMNLWRISIDEISGKPRGQPEAITTPALLLAHPTISADGRRIAYSAVAKEINIQQLALDPATGEPRGEPKWLTTGSRLWANPDPTPDGEWVTFYSQDQPEGDVYVMKGDRTGRRQLTRDDSVQVLDRVPRWSPDKAWVAFFSDRSGQLAVWKVRADGSDRQQVTRTGSIPVWSPDSKRLVTPGTTEGFAGLVAVFDANRRWDEQKPEPLARPDKAVQSFIPNDWSPDGSRLAGMSTFSDRGGSGIVVYSFATRTYERLTDFGEWPAWFGDSRRILFVNKGKEFWLYDTRTKQPRKVYSTVWDVLGPPRLTRDARNVFFSRRVTEADVYLLTFEE